MVDPITRYALRDVRLAINNVLLPQRQLMQMRYAPATHNMTAVVLNAICSLLRNLSHPNLKALGTETRGVSVMKQDWLIEEELIEWLDEFNGLREKYAREIRLVSPTGEIVGRRLAIGQIIEHYLVFEKSWSFTWFYPTAEPIVFTVQLPPEVQRRWAGRSLMLYDRDNIRFREATWQLVGKETTRPDMQEFCSSQRCSRCLVEVYRYSPSQPFYPGAVVEWRICFRKEPPLQGREVPICAELWWNGQLKRRHSLIHYREATPEERVFFRPPRKAKRRQVELKTDPFSPLNEYTPFLLKE